MERALQTRGHSAPALWRCLIVLVALPARVSAQCYERCETDCFNLTGPELVTCEKETGRLQAYDALHRKIVRVTFGEESFPYLVKDGNGNWNGVLKQLLDQLEEEIGFIPEITEISTEALSKTGGDKNTACARDIHMNKTDLCVSDIWVTKDRASYARVLPAIWQEKFQMGVATKEETFNDAVFSAFTPFSPLLWFAIVCTIVAYNTFAWYVEVDENTRDFPDKDLLSSSASGVYHGFYGYFWQEPATRPVTAEGKLALLGLGLFTLIMLSSYTASLASVLVTEDSGALVKSFDEALVGRKQVCMYASLRVRARRLYPVLPRFAVTMDSYEDGYAKMASGECDVILVDSMFHTVAQSRSARECNKVLVGSAIWSISCAWFGADWLVGPMSFFLAEAISRGDIDSLVQASKPSTSCAAVETDQQGLRVWDMSGVFFIIIAFALAAILVHGCRHVVNEGVRRSDTLKRWSEKTFRINKTQVIASDVEDAKAPGTRQSMGSIGSLMAENNPGVRFVLNYRNEPTMRRNPFERALVVAGALHAQSMATMLAEVDSIPQDRRASRGSGKLDRDSGVASMT